jgi:hypothetical protein
MTNWECREDVVSSGMLCFIRYLVTNSTVQGHIRIFPCFLVLPSNLDPLNRLSDIETDFQDCSCGELIFVVEKCAQHELSGFIALTVLFSVAVHWDFSTGAIVTLCAGHRHNSKIHHFMHIHITGEGGLVSAIWFVNLISSHQMTGGCHYRTVLSPQLYSSALYSA